MGAPVTAYVVSARLPITESGYALTLTAANPAASTSTRSWPCSGQSLGDVPVRTGPGQSCCPSSAARSGTKRAPIIDRVG